MNKVILVGLICSSLATVNAQQPTPTSVVRVTEPSLSLVGKSVPSWKFSRQSWMNTRRPIRWSRLKGKVTIIEFFRVQCSHCQEAAPSRRALYLKYRSRGLRVIGLQSPGPDLTENNWKKVQTIARTWKLPYPIAFDAKGVLFKKYGLSFYPTVLVVDRKGIVRFQQTGYSKDNAKKLEKFVAKML